MTVLSELAKLGEWVKEVFSLLPVPVSAVFFLLFSIIIFFSILKMLH